MALNINGRMKVKTLKADFKKEFGLTLRVYDGRSFADDNATLASIRKGDSKGGEFSPKRNTKVGNLEDKIMDMFGIKTQVAGSDDSYLCDNDYTLAKALEADEKLMVKRGKREVKVNDAEITEVNNKDSNAGKKYFEVKVTGNGGEYTAGFISESNEIEYLTDRNSSGELDLMNDNPNYDKNDENSILGLSCLDRDNILHSYGVDCADDFTVVVKELTTKDSSEYISDTVIWEGANYAVATARLYNPNYLLDEPEKKYGDAALVLTSISREENITIKYLVETSEKKFGCLVFGTTLMDETMDGIEDEIIDNAYYFEQDSLEKFLNEQLENANEEEKEAYQYALKEYSKLDFTDENISKSVASLVQDLFESIVSIRDLDSGHQKELSLVLKEFELEKIDTKPGESISIEVSLKSLGSGAFDDDSGDFVDDDIFDDDDFNWDD